jgi:putative DNA methylase
VPQGIPKSHWDRLSGVERFYLKMLDMEDRGAKTLDNFQNLKGDVYKKLRKFTGIQ